MQVSLSESEDEVLDALDACIDSQTAKIEELAGAIATDEADLTATEICEKEASTDLFIGPVLPFFRAEILRRNRSNVDGSVTPTAKCKWCHRPRDGKIWKVDKNGRLRGAACRACANASQRLKRRHRSEPTAQAVAAEVAASAADVSWF